MYYITRNNVTLRYNREEKNMLMNIANCHEYSIFRFVTLSFFDKNKLIISHATSVATSARGRRGRKEEGSGRNGREFCALY